MLRVLTLATLFPNAHRPNLGGFVARQTKGLAALPDVEVEVAAPVGMPPWLLSRHSHYAPLAALPATEIWEGLRVHRPRFPVLTVVGQRWTPRLLARTLVPMLADLRGRFPFDVIDAEFFWPDGPAAVALGRRLGVPVSIKARGADIHFWGRRRSTAGQVLAAGRHADGLLAVSGALADDMAALGMERDRIAVHHTGVDLDRFKPTDKDTAKQALGIAGPLVVTPGALIERKGQAIAIDALRSLPGATLLLVGDGPDRPALERQAAAQGARIRFTGAVPNARVAELLAAADVMLLPTRSEGLANVWVEALACGTPVVTCDVGGAREAIPEDCGRLVGRDPAAFAAAAWHLIAHPPASECLRDAAARFSWQRNAEELRAHLARLVAAAGTSSPARGGGSAER